MDLGTEKGLSFILDQRELMFIRDLDLVEINV